MDRRGELRELVQSVVKHAKFRALSIYSLQTLAKQCSPAGASAGWHAAAATAAEVGVTECVRAIVGQHPTDSEVFLLALTLAQAVAVVGHAGDVVADGTVGALLGAYSKLAAAAGLPPAGDAVRDGRVTPAGAYDPAGPHAEAAAAGEGLARFLAFVCLQVSGAGRVGGGVGGCGAGGRGGGQRR